LEDEHHLLLAKDTATVVHKEIRSLALGRKRCLGLCFLLVELSLGGALFLALFAAAATEGLVQVGEGFLASHDALGNELG